MTQDNSTPYRFERLDRSQLWAVKALYFSAFGVHISEAELIAKYGTERFGAAYTGVVAYSPEGEPAAYYGVFPIRVRVAGKDLLAAQSGDTMTAPNHRMKGLFVQAARRAYQIAKDEGVAFVYGLPNEKSYQGLVKLDWVFHGHMYNFRLRVLTMPLVPLAKKYPAIASWIKPWVDRRLRRHALPASSLAEGAFDTHAITEVAHDMDFLQYKLNGLAHLIRWRGFDVMIRLDGDLVVGGVAPFPVAETARFIQAMRALARRLFCHRLLFQVNPLHWLYARLSEAGLPSTQNLPIGFLPLEEGDYHLAEMSFSRLDLDMF